MIDNHVIPMVYDQVFEEVLQTAIMKVIKNETHIEKACTCHQSKTSI